MPVISVIPLGVRGSAPCSGEEYLQFGGDTSCILLRMGGEVIVLDGGSGLRSLSQYLRPEEKNIHFFLSHAHIDHMLGIPICPVLFDQTIHFQLYGQCHCGLSPKEQVNRLLSPPLWPVGLSAFLADLSFHTVEASAFSLGRVAVSTLPSNHPGGSTLYRFCCDGVSVVYATDMELTQGNRQEFGSFIQGCTLLLADGQYCKAELANHAGFGHSAYEDMVAVAVENGVAQTKILHHSFTRTDQQLLSWEKALQAAHPTCSFARAGREILL